MSRLLHAAYWPLAAALAAAPAAARAAVYVNGVDVSGAALSQKFEHCTVTFDGKGNVLIDAPGYSIQSVTETAVPAQVARAAVPAVPTPAPAPAPPPVAPPPPLPVPVVVSTAPPPPAPLPAAASSPAVLTRKYFVDAKQSLPGMAQYDIDLFIDGKWVRKFRSDDGEIVTEVTSYLHPGPNQVLFVAKKDIVGARKSFSPAASYTILLGAGEASGDMVVIDAPLLTFKRSADEMDDASQSFTVDGR